MTESRYRWFVASGLVARDEGNHDRAIDFLDQAEELYRPGFFPDVRPIAAIKARVRIAQGALSEAAGWARERGLSVTDEVSYLREYNHLTLVRLLIVQERADSEGGAVRGVHRLLAELLAQASSSGRAGSVVEIRMLQALVYHVQGHRQQALEALRCAWEEASEPDEYVRLFLDEGAPMVELLRSAMHDGGTVAHASRLLNLGKGSAAQTSRPGERPASAVDSLSEREIQVLKLLDSALTGPEIARELFISHNTLRSHTKHVFTKLGVTSRRAAVLCARDHGLI